MSWDAYLTDDRGHTEIAVNYTHNCNVMANTVIVALTDLDATVTWWKHLDGMIGSEGAHFLDLIIMGLESDPARFRKINPPNGWGDYDTFLETLRKMRDAVPEWPTTWSTSG